MRLRKSVTTPAICEDDSDFYKLSLAFTHSITADMDEEDTEYVLFGLKLMMHEYAALVYRGDIEPYDFSGVEEIETGFRDVINLINEKLVACGIPTKETTNGKITFDVEKIRKEAERLNGEA